MSRKLKPVPGGTMPKGIPSQQLDQSSPTLEQIKAGAFDAAQQAGMWAAVRDQLTEQARRIEGAPKLQRLNPQSSS